MRIALNYSEDDDPNARDAALAELLNGVVVAASYNSSADTLMLTYADGRVVSVILDECKTHRCDHTNMLVEGLPR